MEELTDETIVLCDSCKHGDKEWHEEPCDSCCGTHSGYEPKGGD